MASWQFEDLFKLDGPAQAELKTYMAAKLGLQLGQLNKEKPFSYAVGGSGPYDKENVAKAQHMYKDKTGGRFYQTTVSALQIQWSSLSHLNIPYVKQCVDKYVLSKGWDPVIERRAVIIAGQAAPVMSSNGPTVVPPPGSVVDTLVFQLSNMSSLLALIAHTVCKFKENPDSFLEDHKDLVQWFCGIRVTIYWDVALPDLQLLNWQENLEQGERKQYTELDNVDAVHGWLNGVEEKLRQQSSASSASASDVFKYALCLRSPVKEALPEWVMSLPRVTKDTTWDQAKKVIAATDVNKLQKGGASVDHRELSSYESIRNRVRFIRGFDSAALKALFDWAAEVPANIKFPLATTVLMGKLVLNVNAFTRASDKADVPGWKNGKFQLQMVDALRMRFKHLCHLQHSYERINLFASDLSWVSYARFMPAIEYVFKPMLEQSMAPDAARLLQTIVLRGVVFVD